jgi:plasmid stabilization system protein ParE
MRVRYTKEARGDLSEIFAYVRKEYPEVLPKLVSQMRYIRWHIGRWPQSAVVVDPDTDTRMVPVPQYPYNLFFRIKQDVVEVLFVHHSARRDRNGSG